MYLGALFSVGVTREHVQTSMGNCHNLVSKGTRWRGIVDNIDDDGWPLAQLEGREGDLPRRRSGSGVCG